MKTFFSICILISMQLVVNAQSADVHKSNGIMHEGLGDYVKSAEAYAKAVEAYEAEGKVDSLCLIKAGMLHNKIKQFVTAEQYLLECTQRAYYSADLYLSLAQCYEGKKEFSEAVKYLEEGRVKFPEESVAINMRLAYVYYNTKQFNKALEPLNELIDNDTQNSNVYYLNGTILEKLKQYEESAKSFEKVLELKPTHTKTLKKIGFVYYKAVDEKIKYEKKQYEALSKPTRVDYSNYKKKVSVISQELKVALPYLEKSYMMNPTDKNTVNCLVATYKRLGMTEKANEIAK